MNLPAAPLPPKAVCGFPKATLPPEASKLGFLARLLPNEGGGARSFLLLLLLVPNEAPAAPPKVVAEVEPKVVEVDEDTLALPDENGLLCLATLLPLIPEPNDAEPPNPLL